MELYFENAAGWRDWLSENHDKVAEVWLVYYKKDTGKPTMTYDDSLDEALCYGWIDSIIKKLDEERYARKFTPRKDNSKWSDANKKRVARLIKNKWMTDAGMAKVHAAKVSGAWDAPDRPQISEDPHPEFAAALERHPVARKTFDSLAPSHRRHYIAWIAVAKRPETRAKRIDKAIELLNKGQKLGMV